MASVVFRAKAHPLPDGRYLLDVPVLARRHCDMAAFRNHPKYGGLANSDLFPNVLARLRRDLFGDSAKIFSNREYPGVTIDDSGFLHTVTIEV